MFGFEKKKPKKKAIKKVSTGVKEKVSKKVSKEEIKEEKTEEEKSENESTDESETEQAEAKNQVGKLKVGKKSFDSPKDMEAYYAGERIRMKKAMQKYKIGQAEGYMNIAKSNLMKLLSQKKKMDQIGKDLEEHKNLLNKKIDEFQVKKVKTLENKERTQNLVDKMKFLEDETKKILDTKQHLNQREAELIAEMRKIAKVAKKDLNLSDLKDSSELDKFEISKEGVLHRAQELLSQESENLFADNSLLDELNNSAVRKINELNTQLAKLHGAKKEALRKRHILNLSEKETEKALAKTESKVKNLKEKYSALLRK